MGFSEDGICDAVEMTERSSTGTHQYVHLLEARSVVGFESQFWAISIDASTQAQGRWLGIQHWHGQWPGLGVHKALGELSLQSFQGKCQGFSTKA
jgi:hypothetical protein